MIRSEPVLYSLRILFPSVGSDAVTVRAYHIALLDFSLDEPQRPQSVETTKLHHFFASWAVIEIHHVVGEPPFAICAGLVLLPLHVSSETVLSSASCLNEPRSVRDVVNVTTFTSFFTAKVAVRHIFSL